MIFRIMMEEHVGSFENYNLIRREKGKSIKNFWVFKRCFICILFQTEFMILCNK